MAHMPGSCRLPFCPIPRLPSPLTQLCLALPDPPHPSMLSVGWALSLNSPLQWQAVSPSEKTPDLKRALRTLLSKMKVMSTAATNRTKHTTESTVSLNMHPHAEHRTFRSTRCVSHMLLAKLWPPPQAPSLHHLSSVMSAASFTGASARTISLPLTRPVSRLVADFLNGATLLLGHFAYFFPHRCPPGPITEHVCFHTAA